MNDSTELFTISMFDHEIHGRVVDLFGAWSKESLKFPAKHLPAFATALACFAAAEAPADVAATSRPPGFALDAAAFELTGDYVYDGPHRGDVSTAWQAEDARVSVYVDTPYSGEYTVAQARQLAADLLTVLNQLDDLQRFNETEAVTGR